MCEVFFFKFYHFELPYSGTCPYGRSLSDFETIRFQNNELGVIAEGIKIPWKFAHLKNAWVSSDHSEIFHLNDFEVFSQSDTL